MKPHLQLAQTRTPSGLRLTLHEHDGTYAIRCAGSELMNSSVAASERRLGELGLARMGRHPSGRILIGGLGLGFTLRSVLQLAGPRARIVVAELLPEVVQWNRIFLRNLNGECLEDPRVEIRTADVAEIIANSDRQPYDAILLDVDNGPVAMVQAANSRLYQSRGLQSVTAALKPGGRLVVWSARPDRAFAQRLVQAGFHVTTEAAKLHPGAKRATYTIYIADLPSASGAERRSEPVRAK